MSSHCRSRHSAPHQVPPAVQHRPNHPPYTVRYGNPNPTSWPTVSRHHRDHNQCQQTFVRACPRPATLVQPISTLPSRWYNTSHAPQVTSIPTPISCGRSSGSQYVVYRDLANLQGIYPYLNWDISQLPSSSGRAEDACTSGAPSFNDGAISPGCNNIQINFNHPTFNPALGSFGPIMVYPLGNCAEITVENVMDAIYEYFQQPLTCYEWNMISAPERQQISESYHRRISRTHRLSGYERARGPLRVDVLKGCTRFAGLQIMSSLNRSALLYMDLAGWS